MDTPTTSPADPVAIIRQLEPDAIRKRLEMMEREREALLVLLRAAERARRTPAQKAARS